MPRDLSALIKEDTLQGMPQLTKSPEEVDERSPAMDATDEDEMVESFRPMRTSRDELHPYTQTLSISDVDSCTKLEEEAFPPNERCSREKVSGCESFPIPAAPARHRVTTWLH